MKNLILSVCLGSILTLSAPLVMAEKMPDNTVKMSKILEELKEKGFASVQKIEFEDGKYIAKAINSLGKEIKIHLNATSGKIEEPKDFFQPLSALTVAKEVEKAGFKKIFEIEADGEKFEVKALDAQGKKVELKVDARSGEIKKD